QPQMNTDEHSKNDGSVFFPLSTSFSCCVFLCFSVAVFLCSLGLFICVLLWLDPAGRDLEDRFRGSATRARRAEASPYIVKIAAHRRRMCGIGQHAERFGGHSLRGEVVLDEFGDDTPSGHE